MKRCCPRKIRSDSRKEVRFEPYKLIIHPAFPRSKGITQGREHSLLETRKRSQDLRRQTQKFIQKIPWGNWTNKEGVHLIRQPMKGIMLLFTFRGIAIRGAALGMDRGALW